MSLQAFSFLLLAWFVHGGPQFILLWVWFEFQTVQLGQQKLEFLSP